jgi:hypothetical protein
MSRFSDTFYGDNISSPNTADTFGPYVIDVTMNKLTHVKANISFGEAGASFAPGSLLIGAVIWGVEWVPHGDSPYVLPADAGAGNFLWSRSTSSNAQGSATWTPTTDNAEIITYWGATEEWNGQLYMGQEIDLYLAYGIFATETLPPIVASFTMEFACTY